MQSAVLIVMFIESLKYICTNDEVRIVRQLNFLAFNHSKNARGRRVV